MDKHELVLDIIEHPEKYTTDRLAEILSDQETRDIYNLLCKTDSAVEASRKIDVDAEWRHFSDRHSVSPSRRAMRPGSRAASIAAIICTSAVALAAGIAVTVASIRHKPEPAAENEATATPIAVNSPTDSLITLTDTVETGQTPIMFENEPLDTIMKRVATVYGVEVRFNNMEAASLRLYYKLDPELTIDEIVEQLDTFKQISIRRNGNIINID